MCAGIPLFFQEPSHLGVVLQPLLFAVRRLVTGCWLLVIVRNVLA
jgi:hypothetical protein